MTQPSETPEPVCCGEGGPETPGAGKPQVVACMLCPGAGANYWRHRPDGQPYVPVQPLGERDTG